MALYVSVGYNQSDLSLRRASRKSTTVSRSSWLGTDRTGFTLSGASNYTQADQYSAAC